MPCQSYDDSWNSGSSERKIRELKKQADMLARIACKAMNELEANGVEDLLILKDDEVRTWWKKHKEDDAREQARIAEAERRERVKAEALASLSDEAKELLGLTKPGKKARKLEVEIDEDDGECEVEMDWDDHTMPNGTKVRTFRIR